MNRQKPTCVFISEREYQQFLLGNLKLEIDSYIKSSVKHHLACNNDDLLTANIWTETQINPKLPISAMVSIINHDSGSLVYCTDYVVLSWQSKDDKDASKKLLLAKVDEINHGVRCNDLFSDSKQLKVSIHSLQQPILDRIIKSSGNEIALIPITISDLSPFERKFDAMFHIDRIRLRTYLIGPAHISQNNRSNVCDLWRYIGHTKGAFFYEKYLNEMQLAAIRYTLSHSLTLVEGNSVL